jgi:hypothetical protein
MPSTLPCQASLRRVVARRVVSPSSSDSVTMALARRMHSFFQVFFFGSMAKIFAILPMSVSGSVFGSVFGSGSIVFGSGRGTQSTACSGFHESGRTGGKSPGCILTVVVFFSSHVTMDRCHAFAFWFPPWWQNNWLAHMYIWTRKFFSFAR